MEPRDEAIKHLETAKKGGPEAGVQVGIAAVFAVLHVADSIKHSLRDILYELRS